MDKESIREHIRKLYRTVPGNILTSADEVKEEYIGTVMYDSPTAGFGSADDRLFEEFKKVGVIGPWYAMPKEWLDGAQTIVSLFFPTSEEVRKSNYKMTDRPSNQWTYARIEGQAYINRFMEALAAWFEDQGIRTCVPASDKRFFAIRGGRGGEKYAEADGTTFGSNWSERHTAYVCGLGTFGLSKGLISERGVAGRYASVIIDRMLEPDERPYTGLSDYCTLCGACARRCPAGAIDIKTGKDHVACSRFLAEMGKVFKPRYGCGLCQTGVPCETCAPGKKQ